MQQTDAVEGKSSRSLTKLYHIVSRTGMTQGELSSSRMRGSMY